MKKLIFTSLICCLLIGCATSGRVYWNEDKLCKQKPSSVSVSISPNLEYSWPYEGLDIKDIIKNSIKNNLKRKGFVVVDENAEMDIKITRIETGGWTGSICVNTIVITATRANEVEFKLMYKQHTEAFTLKGFFRPSKNGEQIGRVLAKQIAKQYNK
jgi:type III secretory pathway lipoprotein EscJ